MAGLGSQLLYTQNMYDNEPILASNWSLGFDLAGEYGRCQGW